MDLSSIQLFSLNVVVIALFGAIFEICMEKEKGWGAGLDRNRWYGKIVGENSAVMKFLAKSAGVPYFFGYAIAMYFIFVPAILLLQYFFFDVSVFLFMAMYFSILALEDFTWFLLNPYFPALTELLKGSNGSIWWHRKWVKIGNHSYLPQSYFTSVVIVAILLILDRFVQGV